MEKEEIHEYTEMLEDARKQALDRLTQNAHAMGANAILLGWDGIWMTQ